ncbi:Rad1-domain-containing protein [Cristinia sonorae]|uniref:Rad1-domain-containing protein n=1 Tax=Cristinia sonorae TaxID=1940300 RepID=A0A8K0UQ33_9AGAR|nr:Rad1-domain-containing protein [Cristinia sonorae]
MATQEDDRQALSAAIHDLRHFANLLRGLSQVKCNRAHVSLNNGGMVVVVEEARCMLGIAYISNDVFDEYVYRPPGEEDDPEQDEVFEARLNTILECLNVFGSVGGGSLVSNTSKAKKNKRKHRNWHNGGGSDSDSDNGAGGRSNRSGRIEQYLGIQKGTVMRMSYMGPGHPLGLLIAEDATGPTASCEVSTFDAEPLLDLPYENETTVLRIILKSSWLQDALSELHPSCEELTIIGSPPPPAGRAPNANAPPRLRLRATGTFGTTEMDYPNDKEVLETCECPVAVSWTYKAVHISRTAHSLKASLKTSMRINDQGLMSLQFLVPGAGPRGKSVESFLEFRFLPIEEPSQL